MRVVVDELSTPPAEVARRNPAALPPGQHFGGTVPIPIAHECSPTPELLSKHAILREETIDQGQLLPIHPPGGNVPTVFRGLLLVH
jgi:hypothetical protein